MLSFTRFLSSKRIGLLVALLVVAIWGETFVSSKVLLNSGMLPADIFFYRFVIAYSGLVVLSHKRLWADSLRDELLLAAAGLVGGSLYFVVENMSLVYSTASNVAILVGTTPLLTALLMACFYREERMNGRQIIGSLIAFVGLVLVVLNGQMVLHLNPLGDALALGAALLWALYSLCIKPVSTHYDSQFITRKVFGYGLLTILPWFVLVEPLHFEMAYFTTPVVLLNLLWLGVVASLFCFLAWNWSLGFVGVTLSTNMVYTQSAFTMLIAAVVLGEKITWMSILGLLVLVGGMLMITAPKKAECNE